MTDDVIKIFIENKIVFSKKTILTDQIQPASLDLRLGEKAWRVRSSFLPGSNQKVLDKIKQLEMHEIDLTSGSVLEKGCVYIAQVEEILNLPNDFSATSNPKSSTGRLDIFTRLISDNAVEFEKVSKGYSGPLYIEISPRTFSILVRTGSKLNQIRFRKGNLVLDDDQTIKLHNKLKLLSGYNGEIDIRDGIPLTLDLKGNEDGLVGYRARKHTTLIDVDKVASYKKDSFWEKITIKDIIDHGLVLNQDEFYILSSRENVSIPKSFAAEMRAYDTRVGEFRAHYAGFFDPGFGLKELGAKPTKAVLEVRSHDVPFLTEENQTVCRLVFEKMCKEPSQLYGIKGGSSNYQSQGLQLAKQFF